jgi:hypothetical protein
LRIGQIDFRGELPGLEDLFIGYKHEGSHQPEEHFLFCRYRDFLRSFLPVFSNPIKGKTRPFPVSFSPAFAILAELVKQGHQFTKRADLDGFGGLVLVLFRLCFLSNFFSRALLIGQEKNERNAETTTTLLRIKLIGKPFRPFLDRPRANSKVR